MLRTRASPGGFRAVAPFSCCILDPEVVPYTGGLLVSFPCRGFIQSCGSEVINEDEQISSDPSIFFPYFRSFVFTDYFTKPLQGKQSLRFRNTIMNLRTKKCRVWSAAPYYVTSYQSSTALQGRYAPQGSHPQVLKVCMLCTRAAVAMCVHPRQQQQQEEQQQQ